MKNIDRRIDELLLEKWTNNLKKSFAQQTLDIVIRNLERLNYKKEKEDIYEAITEKVIFKLFKENYKVTPCLGCAYEIYVDKETNKLGSVFYRCKSESLNIKEISNINSTVNKILKTIKKDIKDKENDFIAIYLPIYEFEDIVSGKVDLQTSFKVLNLNENKEN